ncbi:helix-turn-helix transcriptional regulator [Sphingomonas sp. KR3-1]|uniref:helix-turn-helix transcriptional regulator n=1 Tax=Sphingomonas sp. KR3-1 TaxID=3156611 RepID=UPI0032B59571
MFASSAFARHVSRVAPDRLRPADRVGLTATKSLAALVDDLARCETADALQQWLADHALRLGFRGARYMHLGHLHLGQRLPHWKLLRFLSTHEDSANLWMTDRAGLETILMTFLPFAWSSVGGRPLTDEQRDWYEVQQLREQPAGVTVPVQDHPAGPACLILFGGTEETALQLVDTQTPWLATLALAFHLMAKAILPASNSLGPALSDREIACLRLAALGETLAEAANKLGVSVRTVELHVARASKKLNAANKIHAVAIAVGAGLIEV